MPTLKPIVLCCFALLSACSAVRTEQFTFTWTPDGAEPRTFEASIERPANPNAHRVMLVGGGSITDIDWTTPGSFTDPNSGETTRFTIDGKPTKDAERISSRLLREGYTVWRWSSIYTNDPLHAQDPAMAQYQRFNTTIDMTRAAFEAFTSRDPDAQSITMLGHSLGAARSIIVGADDPRVTSFVFLAGAYLSNVHRPSDAAITLLRESGLDTDNSDSLTPDEARAFFPEYDIDQDGIIRPWEYAGAHTAQLGRWPDTAPEFQPPGSKAHYPWPSDALIRSRKPALVLSGGLDAQSVHAPILQRKAEDAGAPIECIYYPELGHQLSIEHDNMMTHIDNRALTAIAEWLNAHSK